MQYGKYVIVLVEMLQEKHDKNNKKLSNHYADLERAFDRVP